MVLVQSNGAFRVPTPPGKSWKVLEFLFENFQDLASPGK